MVEKNIFLTHRWSSNSNDYERIQDWLYDDPYYNFRFFSVSKEDYINGNGIDSNIKENIKWRIDHSSVVITFNNLSSSYQESFHKYELEYAIRMQKPIVLIKIYGSAGQIPSMLNNYWNLYSTNWNRESIRNAIINAM